MQGHKKAPSASRDAPSRGPTDERTHDGAGTSPEKSRRDAGAPRGATILHKLVGLMAAVIALLVGALVVYFPAQQMGDLQRGLNNKAGTYGRLLEKQLAPAVAFNDRQTAREAFEAVSEDPEVMAAALYTDTGEILEARGQLAPATEQLARGATELQVVTMVDRVAVVARVVSLEGPRGVLAVEFSTEALEASRSRVMRAALAGGALALAIGVALAWLIGRSIARRLRALAGVATAVAAGDLAQRPVRDGSGDEIGALARAFNAMLAQIVGHVIQTQESAKREQERLEGLVNERTCELNRRNDDMRLLLDNVDQGFLTLDLDTKVSRERSAMVEAWLGPVPAGATFGAYVDRLVPGFGKTFENQWSQVRDDFLPVELTLAQLAPSLRIGERHLTLSYQPIVDAAQKLHRVLVVISDETATIARHRAEQDEREITWLFTRAFEDRAGVVEFMRETDRLLDGLDGAPTDSIVKHIVHTLKGNAATYGLATLAEICGEIEDRFVDQGAGTIDDGDRKRLHERWNQISFKLGSVANVSSHLQIDDSEHAAVVTAVDAGVPRRQIRHMLEAWKLEPLELRFKRIGAQVDVLAQRLARGPVEVRIEANKLRVRSDQFAEFWTAFNHAVRNAVDHGLESVGERTDAGKPKVAIVTLRAKMTDRHFAIEIEDSGRGIDWDAVRRAAIARGLPAETHDEVVAAMFTDGVTTRTEVTETSGRGVGTAALNDVCRRMGGRIEVQSQRGKGACFSFIWPRAAVARSGHSIAPGASLPPTMAAGWM